MGALGYKESICATSNKKNIKHIAKPNSFVFNKSWDFCWTVYCCSDPSQLLLWKSQPHKQQTGKSKAFMQEISILSV